MLFRSPNFWVCSFMFFLGEIQVDQCMARLQELQYTVAGGTKVVSGETLSPRSTRGYLRTSLRCKQESLRYLSPLLPVSSLFPPLFGSWENEFYIIYQFIHLPIPLNQTEPDVPLQSQCFLFIFLSQFVSFKWGFGGQQMLPGENCQLTRCQ